MFTVYAMTIDDHPVYVGGTSRPLNTRFRQHINEARKVRKVNLRSERLRVLEQALRLNKSVDVFPIDSIKMSVAFTPGSGIHRQLEQLWIRQFTLWNIDLANGGPESMTPTIPLLWPYIHVRSGRPLFEVLSQEDTDDIVTFDNPMDYVEYICSQEGFSLDRNYSLLNRLIPS
jgi:hypothetical protein